MNDERTEMATPETSVELRGDCPREMVDVLDAISSARRLTRMQLVNEVLGAWVDQKVHEMNIVARVTRGNPTRTAPSGAQVERQRGVAE